MNYLLHLAIIFAIYGILSLSLNLVVGYAGLFSLTHAAFFGIGAYTTAILLTSIKTNFLASVMLGIIITAIISLLIGSILNKFKNDFYALVSFGFNVILFSVLLNWQKLTSGPIGIAGIVRPIIFKINFTSIVSFAFLSIIFLAISYVVINYVALSSFGRALKAIREDEEIVRGIGYNTNQYKLTVFAISASLAALSGSLYASYISYIDPSSFSANTSVLILSMVILGGATSLTGSVIGATFIICLPELLRFIGLPNTIAAQLQQMIYGFLIVILMIWRPQGICGNFKM